MGIPILGDIIKEVGDLASEFIVDKDKKIEFSFKMAELEDKANARVDALLQGQIEVNKVEAGSGSVFVAGWRPAVGWVGAAALAYSTILYPLMNWGALILGYKGTFPVLDDNLILYIVGGMLGIGGMRSFEKVKGVSTNDYRDVPKPVASTKTETTTKTTDVTVTPEVPKPKPKIDFRHFKI